MTNTLLFIYNANSSRWDKFFDRWHKVLHSKSFSCNLCKLTHGLLKEKTDWIDFKNKSENRMIFLYKDQFLKLHGIKNKRFSFPIILEYINGKYQPLLTATELQKFSETKELITDIKKRLQKQTEAVIKAAS